MRSTDPSSKFRRDVKRIAKGRYRDIVAVPRGELWEVVNALARDIRLPPAYRDHTLRGDREGSRECHIRPDLLLVYRYEGEEWLILERLGSHAEIFGM